MIPLFATLSSALVGGAISKLKSFVIAKLATKAIKCFIDDNFRSKVTPVEGSVVYSDLYLGVEHSGIHVDNGKISNIVVTNTMESTVKLSSPTSFVDSSKLHSKIYVSCDSNGVVGDEQVAEEAFERVGERAFYGLLIKNCHQFSQNCVEVVPKKNMGLFDRIGSYLDFEETWEPSIRNLKSSARKHLGATKWRLWEQSSGNAVSENDLNKIYEQLNNTPLDGETQKSLKQSQAEMGAYQKEIEDENLPQKALKAIESYQGQLKDLIDAGQKSTLLSQSLGYSFTYNDLKHTDNIDFISLSDELKRNKEIQNVLNTLGRAYISEQSKKIKVKRANTNEVYGAHKSSDISRVLPSELVLLDNEELEHLFYAKLLESNLSTYKMLGHHIDLEDDIDSKEVKGPIIACLDTSGSMSGSPINKARALLLAVQSIISKEKRDLSILLFGASGQIEELNLTETSSTGLLPFLCKGFSGGTDFETPLKRAVEIIEQKTKLSKADILMVTDGQCELSHSFQQTLKTKKTKLDITIQTVICTGTSLNNSEPSDGFSDRIIGI